MTTPGPAIQAITAAITLALSKCPPPHATCVAGCGTAMPAIHSDGGAPDHQDRTALDFGSLAAFTGNRK